MPPGRWLLIHVGKCVAGLVLSSHFRLCPRCFNYAFEW